MLHPALGDAQGTSVCVMIPGRVFSDTQLTKLLAPVGKPAGGDVEDGVGRPRMGNGVVGLFALTDCLQVGRSVGDGRPRVS